MANKKKSFWKKPIGEANRTEGEARETVARRALAGGRGGRSSPILLRKISPTSEAEEWGRVEERGGEWGGSPPSIVTF